MQFKVCFRAFFSKQIFQIFYWFVVFLFLLINWLAAAVTAIRRPHLGNAARKNERRTRPLQDIFRASSTRLSPMSRWRILLFSAQRTRWSPMVLYKVSYGRLSLEGCWTFGSKMHLGQCCGSGSLWICINLALPDPDPYWKYESANPGQGRSSQAPYPDLHWGKNWI